MTMEYFDITFRFNDKANSLDNRNGISIDVLANFLKSLYDVTKGVSDGKIVLSEIRGNCYAAVLTSPNITTIDYVQTLHKHIANANFGNLKSKEKEYVQDLMKILRDNLTLNVYNNDKSYYTTIEQTEIPVPFPYFFETDSLDGVVTRIGGRNINTKNTILISTYSGEIEINNAQDNKLKKFYKNGVLEFYITKKINKETGKVEKTVLDDFVALPIPDISFTEGVNSIRERHGEYFSKIDLEDYE